MMINVKHRKFTKNHWLIHFKKCTLQYVSNTSMKLLFKIYTHTSSLYTK